MVHVITRRRRRPTVRDRARKPGHGCGRHTVMRLLLAAVTIAACAGPPPPSIAPAAAHGNPCVRAGRPCVDMYVVAHEDDDLLFMNPDIAHSIAAGNRVIIVHVTTGDLPTASVAAFANQQDPPDFTGYWVDRERGILNAFTA